MKILVLSDHENRALWDHYDKSRAEGVDLILSCGDLNPNYLEFLVTMTNVPLLYVRGNHDERYDQKPPLGCTPIDDKIYYYKGLRILGLGGCMRYKNSGIMYTERQMQRRINRLSAEITLKNGFDILLTHAPAKGYGDLDDLPHQGFDCFNELMEHWKPKYMLHGHVHKEYGHFEREHIHPCGTKIINCYQTHFLELCENEYPSSGKTGSFLYDLYLGLKRG